MKKLLITTLILLSLNYVKAQNPVPVTLSWTYPTNELSTNLIFKLYSSQDITIPLTNWVVLTNIIGTQTSVTLNLVPSSWFFAMKGSNFWGEGVFSNVASTPAPPRSDSVLSLRRGENSSVPNGAGGTSSRVTPSIPR